MLSFNPSASSPLDILMLCAIVALCAVVAVALTMMIMYAEVWSRTPRPRRDVFVYDEPCKEVR